MSKNKIYLTEQKLQSIIKESVKTVLNELSFGKMYGAYRKMSDKANELNKLAKDCHYKGDEKGGEEYRRKADAYYDRAEKMRRTFQSMYNGEKDGISQSFGNGNDYNFTVSSSSHDNNSLTGVRDISRAIKQSGAPDKHNTDYYYDEDYRTTTDKYKPKAGDVLARERRKTIWNDGKTSQYASKFVVDKNHDRKMNDSNFWPWHKDEYQGEFETPEFDRLSKRQDDINKWIAGKKDSSEFRTNKK